MNTAIHDRLTALCAKPISQCENKELYSALLKLVQQEADMHLQPVTGRTHQLRVHCAYAGHPILGDRQYGTEASLALREYPHQQLCAVRVTFPHPITKEPMTIQSRQGVCL